MIRRARARRRQDSSSSRLESSSAAAEIRSGGEQGGGGRVGSAPRRRGSRWRGAGKEGPPAWGEAAGCGEGENLFVVEEQNNRWFQRQDIYVNESRQVFDVVEIVRSESNGVFFYRRRGRPTLAPWERTFIYRNAPSCRLPRLPLASPRLLQPQQCSAVNYSYTGIAVEIPGCLLVLLQDWSFSRWKSKS